MDKLPQELIDHITSFVDYDDLDRILTLSKAFQRSVEKVMLTDYELEKGNEEKFLRLYSSGERANYLRCVTFSTTLPMAGGGRDWDKGCREKPDELLAKDEAFTQQIGFLFKTLKCLEDRAGPKKMAGRVRLIIYPPTRAVKVHKCRHLTCVCWRVHLLRPESLPQLSSIRSIEMKRRGYFHITSDECANPDNPGFHAPSKLDLRILIDLASKSKFIEHIKWTLPTYFEGMDSARETLRHFTQDWAGPHRDTRHDFARSLESITLPSLKHIHLEFHHPRDAYPDQRNTLPNLVLPRPYDPFSSSLRVLSYHLETMILRAAVDQTLFWPTSGASPYWPNLKYLNVFFCPYSPSGKWYFQGPQGEGSDTSAGYQITEAHYEPMEANTTDRHFDNEFIDPYLAKAQTSFRIKPIDKNLCCFLRAFAQAANKMPSLRKAVLWTGLDFYPGDIYNYYKDLDAEIEESVRSLGWGIAYVRPGEDVEMLGMGHKDCASRQFWWMTHNWRPEDELYSLFDGIGQSAYEDKAIHHWASAQGHKWYDRSIFDLIR